MSEQKYTVTGNSILAIMAGAAAMVLTALILFPLIQIVVDEFFEFRWGSERGVFTFNYLIFYISLIAWFAIPAFAGGIVSSLISRSNEVNHAWFLFFLFTGILIIMQAGEKLRGKDILIDILLLAGVCLMLHKGARKGIRIKEKRRRGKEPDGIS